MTQPAITADSLKCLWENQIHCWDTARRNYEALASVQERTLEIDGIAIRIQHNPGRIASVSSTPRFAAERPCFLCNDNLPHEQLRLPYTSDYQILVNPFPIFRHHFTIPAIAHTPQRIDGRIEAMLDLARLCTPYTLFYNGARCGASAPMHMHFQAGEGGFLPIESQWQGADSVTIATHGDARLSLLEKMLRPIFLITSTSRDHAAILLNKLCRALPAKRGEEPMMNIVARHESGQWIVFLFPRSKHRPDRYYAADATQRLISPGSVEMGGVIITPRPDDFKQLTAQDITEIYQEICPEKKAIDNILEHLQ